MSTTVSAPPTTPQDRASIRGRRRRLPWTLAAAAVILVTFLSVAGTSLANYEPLTWDLSYRSPRPFAHSLGSFTSPHGDSFEAFGIECHAGQPVKFSFILLNDGPVGVTVTQLFSGYDGDRRDLGFLTRPEMGPGTGPLNHLVNGRLEPFRPFSLSPHSYRRVGMSMVVNRCDPNTVFGDSASEMTFRVLGMTRHQNVYWPLTLSFSNTGKGSI